MNKKLTNIFNLGRKLYLFSRPDNKDLKYEEITSFYPYYYQEVVNGRHTTITGKKVDKIHCKNPGEVARKRDNKSWEADIVFRKRYMIDKLNIEKTNIRYLFVDIEVLTNVFPEQPFYPISCITLWDNYTDKYCQYYLGDYKNETELMNNFVNKVKELKPDILLGWNFVKFDWNYIVGRFPDVPKRISIINKFNERTNSPAGISIIDFMSWVKKIYKYDRYSLDFVAEKALRMKVSDKPNFGELSEDIKNKNMYDVERMVALEKKFKLIPHYDEIRRMGKVEWEDLIWYSRIIDSIALQIAKEKNIILPTKSKIKEKVKFEGAYRETFESGSFYGVTKYDLSGAYLYSIIDLCLDSSNITNNKEGIPINITDRKTNKILNTYFVKQNSETLLPTLAKKLVTEKNKYKELKNNTNPELPEYKDVEQKYEAIKSIVLSSWGVLGNQHFRLFDPRVAGMITSIVRDLLHYVKDKLAEKGYNVIYVDTDSVFITGEKNIIDLLNNLVKQWSKDRFGKETSIEFDYEGIYEKLLILSTCHYIGYINTGKGIKKEIKGIEAKRSSSAKYEAQFQEELIDKVLNKKTEKENNEWIKERIDNFKNSKLTEISFPVKLSKSISEYKNKAIHIRALENTQKINPKFIKRVIEPYFYCFVKDKEEVLAFDDDTFEHIKNIDWEKMKERNIHNKVRAIFRAMKWEYKLDKKKENNLSSYLGG